MRFTLKELNMIKHNMEVALRRYEETQETCKKSDDPNSLYQIYERQIQATKALIDKIENTEV